MITVDLINKKIAELQKEHGKTRRSYYVSNVLYGLSIPFFLITGALSIVATPFMAVSWLTIGAGLASSYRKHLAARRAKLDGIEKNINNLKGMRRIDVSERKKTERSKKINNLKTSKAQHTTAIKKEEKKRAWAGRVFGATTIAGLIWPIPFAIVAPIALAVKAKTDSDFIGHTKRIEAANKEIDYLETEQAIAEEVKTIRNSQRSTSPTPAPAPQPTRQAASSTPTISRDEQIINAYIELLSKKPEELHKGKTLIKK